MLPVPPRSSKWRKKANFMDEPSFIGGYQNHKIHFLGLLWSKITRLSTIFYKYYNWPLGNVHPMASRNPSMVFGRWNGVATHVAISRRERLATGGACSRSFPPRYIFNPFFALWHPLGPDLVYIYIPAVSLTESGCARTEFICSDLNCVSFAMRCDGSTDCPDNSDEVNCPGTL